MNESRTTLNWRMPAEWEPHSATILSWPTNRDDWPGRFQPIPWIFVEMAKRLTQSEPLILLVQSSQQELRVRAMLARSGVSLERVRFLSVQTDRGWMRDIAPFFVMRDGAREKSLQGVHFSFNGWAKYDNWRRDATIPAFLSIKLRFPMRKAAWKDHHVILEGGAVDVNGDGVMLATEECLLDEISQCRNPGFIKKDYEELLKRWLGIKQVIWLEKGIVGDDTHGHVDDVCRFVGRDTVVLCAEPNSADPNHVILGVNRERLESVRLVDGARLQIVELPMPEPLVFDGVRLPASYANYYVTNKMVLVPTFNDPNDRKALGILGELFSDRTVVGIHAVELVWGLGALHCLTHEVPASAQFQDKHTRSM